MDRRMTSPSLMKSPPRCSRKRNSSLIASPAPFGTPTKTPSHRKLNSSVESRFSSPSPSLVRSSRRYGTPNSSSDDRFIPSRRNMNIDLCRRALLTEDTNIGNRSDAASPEETKTTTPIETPVQKEYKRRMLSSLCNVPLDALDENAAPRGIFSFGQKENPMESKAFPRARDPFSQDTLRVLQRFEDVPDIEDSRKSHNDAINRRIPSQPTRILDAPNLVDDFYLNLISWSEDNVLAVALAHCVYLWNATSGEIQHLTTVQGNGNYVTSVSWCTKPGTTHWIAIGTNVNNVQLWDTHSLQCISTLSGHSGRVVAMAWNQHWLTTGGRDRLILQHDVRIRHHLVSTYRAHEQEVCGLKWNDEGTALASGGNDNNLCIWDAAMSSVQRQRRNQGSAHWASDVGPRLVLQQHKAAVKALDWCPFRRGVLASGGGTADRTIKLWNSNSGAMLNSLDTGSQVCSLVWSRHQRELCSSHGFSENQLMLWRYGSGSNLTKVKELTGHTSRVLSLACSPDGSTVVSAAGDESLRFWNIFGTPPSRRSENLNIGELSFGMPQIR
eukprot:Nitzschia sp. Nitz4//scaffold274_size25273//8452//10116//NITZ4_008327-RA/size25273-processed-gene-0.13-mRNA-1//-1//CDS//3329545281//8215//frame0